MKAKYVYVVSYHGGANSDVVAAWSSLREALDYVEKGWEVRPTHTGGVQWKAELNDDGVHYGWLHIRRLSLKGATA